MRSEKGMDAGAVRGGRRLHCLPWVSGLAVLPVCWLLFAILPSSKLDTAVAAAAACALAPAPGLALAERRRRRMARLAHEAAEESARLKLELDAVRYRTARLREDLSAADRQARQAHQLTLLGQFTAGFMHEFNNPLSIVTSRVEILLEERRDDRPLCADLEEMLKETRYMGNIARTLLQALRRERGVEVFDPASPAEVLNEVLAAMAAMAEHEGARLVTQRAEAPRVNLPAHVISEVVRGLIANAIQALRGRLDGTVWLRIEPYRAAASKVVLRVEDNGPGVPESIRARLFEPFVSESRGREHLGLGLFLAASLLDVYDGRLRYEPRPGGGAAFVLELPPARFVRGQPYHWFMGGEPA
jgi:signal transduction histidine kinase